MYAVGRERSSKYHRSPQRIAPSGRRKSRGRSEQVLAELNAAGADDVDINKITWQNSCRFFSWDPFVRTPRQEATVKALRARATDVDVSIRPRKEWARLYEQKQPAKA